MVTWRTSIVGVALAVSMHVSAANAAPDEVTAAPAAAPSADAPPASLPEVTAAAFQGQIAQIKGAKELDDDAKNAIIANYQNALAELEREATLAAKAAGFKKSAQEAQERLKEVRAMLDQPQEVERVEVPAGMPTGELETKLAAAQDKLSQAQDELTRLETEPQRRAERRLKTIPAQIDAANNKLDDIRKQLAAPAAADISKEMAAAQQALLAARAKALIQEIACCTAERESYNAEDDLLPKQRDLVERGVAGHKRLVEAWQKAIYNRRQREAAAKLSSAQRERRFVSPELRRVAEENEELAKAATKINNDVAAVSKQTVEFTNALNEVDREYKNLEKVDLGLAQQFGPYLLQCRVELARRRRQLEAARLPKSQVGEAYTQWLDLTERRKKMSDLDQRAEELLHGLDLSAAQSPRPALEAEARQLLLTRRELIDSLIGAYERYNRAVPPLMTADKELFDKIAEQSDFIDKRILWVRSIAPLGRSDLPAAAEAVHWLARPQEWRAVGQQIAHAATANAAACLLACGVFVALLSCQVRMRRHVRELGDRAARGSADDMSLTVRALLLTFLMSAPWPLLLAVLGWLLERAPNSTELGRALAHGLRFSAVALVSMEFLRHVCRGRGLGTAHFGWSETSARILRKELRWLMLVALPITLVGAGIHVIENDRWQALGRLLFIGAMLALSVFLHRVLRPVGGVLQGFSAAWRGGWFDRLHRIAHPLLASGPLALAVLAGFGYYYTGRQLAWRLQATGWLLVAFLIGGALMLRWLLIMRRRLAMRQARLRRAAAQQEQRPSDGAELPSVPTAAEGQLDLTTINQQTHRFVRTALLAGFAAGLWLIWADVLPALSLFNVELWSSRVDDPGGSFQYEPVNVSHLLEAVIALVLTLVAARNIPGLLEIVLLQRLPLDPATRYAVTALFRYAISVAGIVGACAVLGITWSKVHWLVAAVSVGLGFGLQEIFANFISGLIILFERPIRVGDIVTVGDVSGVVSRIRMRATMITDFDRKELIMPNKEFITGRVLNWTLSDQMNRVTIDVGVAYGSDTEKARRLLLEAATENQYILKDPPPFASFEGFGDSVLNLVLRCYLPNLENRSTVVHDLHTRIHETFREEGIDIAFPQLDLHIRTTPVSLYQRQAG